MRAAVLILFLGFVLFGFQEAIAKAYRNQKQPVTTDFDEHVRQWVERKAKQVGRKVSWWDLYGQHQHLRERPQYHKFKISARTSQMNYNTLEMEENDRPQQVYSKWFCNHQTKQPMTTTISREIKKTAKFSWMQENGLKIGVSLSIKATIPGIMDIGAGFSTELDFRGRNTEVKEETETFKIQYDLKIDPQTAVLAKWVITEREVEVPYDVDVYIDGYAAVWFDQKTDDHWLWFYPTSHMAEGKFRQYSGGLEFESTGIFNGVKGIDSVIEAHEYTLTPGMESQCGNSAMVQNYQNVEPIKVTRVKMPLPTGEKHGD